MPEIRSYVKAIFLQLDYYSADNYWVGTCRTFSKITSSEEHFSLELDLTFGNGLKSSELKPWEIKPVTKRALVVQIKLWLLRNHLPFWNTQTDLNTIQKRFLKTFWIAVGLWEYQDNLSSWLLQVTVIFWVIPKSHFLGWKVERHAESLQT